VHVRDNLDRLNLAAAKEGISVKTTAWLELSPLIVLTIVVAVAAVEQGRREHEFSDLCAPEERPVSDRPDRRRDPNFVDRAAAGKRAVVDLSMWDRDRKHQPKTKK